MSQLFDTIRRLHFLVSPGANGLLDLIIQWVVFQSSFFFLEHAGELRIFVLRSFSHLFMNQLEKLPCQPYPNFIPCSFRSTTDIFLFISLHQMAAVPRSALSVCFVHPFPLISLCYIWMCVIPFVLLI